MGIVKGRDGGRVRHGIHVLGQVCCRCIVKVAVHMARNALSQYRLTYRAHYLFNLFVRGYEMDNSYQVCVRVTIML
jgi:hypothetical protein